MRQGTLFGPEPVEPPVKIPSGEGYVWWGSDYSLSLHLPNLTPRKIGTLRDGVYMKPVDFENFIRWEASVGWNCDVLNRLPVDVVVAVVKQRKFSIDANTVRRYEVNRYLGYEPQFIVPVEKHREVIE